MTIKESLQSFPWETLVANLAADSGNFFILIPAMAYVLAIAFLIAAIKQAANAGNPNSRSDHSKHAWVWSLGLSSVLFAFPTTIGGLTATMFGSDDTENAMAIMTKVQGSGKLAPLVPLFAIFGLLAVMRGLILLRGVAIYGNHSKGNASFSRSAVLIISGVLLVNFKKTLAAVSAMTGRPVGADMFDGAPAGTTATPSVGVSLGKMVGHIAESMGGVAAASEALLYLMGLSFLVTTLFAAWKYKKTDGRDGNMTLIVTSLVLAVCCISAPRVLNTGIQAIFKDSGVVKVELAPSTTAAPKPAGTALDIGR